MHRKHIRATVGTADVDIPTGTFIANRFLYFNGLAIITVTALQGPVSSTDNAVTRWDGTTGTLVQNSVVIIDDAGAVTGVTTLNTRDPAKWVDGPTPATSTDNAVARWDGTTGRLIQNSVVAINDTGDITGVTSINTVPVGDFVRGPTPALATNNHVALWDTTSGRLIKDSPVTIDPTTGDITTPGDITPGKVSGIPVGVLVKSSSGTPHPDNSVARWDAAAGNPIQDSTVFISDTGAVTGVTTLNGIDPSTWVVGPASSTNLRVAAFNGTTGKLLLQANYELKNVATVATGDGVTSGRITQFGGSQSNSGTSIQDSGVVFSDLAFRTGSYTIGNVPRFVNSGGVTFIFEDSGIPSSSITTGTGAATSGDLVRFSSAGPTSYRIAATGIAYQNVVSTSSNPSTDNRIARYDGTSGVIVQQSAVTIDDSGNITGAGTLNTRTIANWVDGPAIASDSAVALFNGTTGKLIQSSGIIVGVSSNVTGLGTLNTRTIANWVDGPAIASDSAVALFNGTTGKLIQSSGIIVGVSSNVTGLGTLNTRTIARWVDGPAAGGSTDNTLAVWDGTTGRLLKDGSSTAIAVDPGTGVITTPVGVLVHSNVSHTDNAAVRWDGTGYKTQDSTVIIDDSGNVSGVGTLNTRTIADWVEASSTFPTAGRILVAASNGTRVIQPSGVAVTDFVTASANFGTDNLLLRSDGTTKGAQASVVSIDDSGNITGVVTINGSAPSGDQHIGPSASNGTVTTNFAIGSWTPITAGDWALTLWIPISGVTASGTFGVTASWGSGTGSAGFSVGSGGGATQTSGTNMAANKTALTTTSGLMIVSVSVVGMTAGTGITVDATNTGTSYQVKPGVQMACKDS